MLARVAESLYWIGRNIERVEHCTRYLKVQYFSTLEAPMLQNKDFTFRSILFMSGADFEPQNMLPENEVWRKVIFDAGNPNSIFSIVKYAMENARSIRNAIVQIKMLTIIFKTLIIDSLTCLSFSFLFSLYLSRKPFEIPMKPLLI